MTTIKSSSEKSRFVSIYRSAVKGQVAFGIIATIVFVLLIPLVFFVSMEPHTVYGHTDPAQIAAYYRNNGYFENGIYIFDVHAGFVLFTLVIFAFVVALIQNAYLHSKKTVDLYHSLPVKRQHLLGANMLAALTVVLGPYLAVYLVTMVAQLVQYGAHIPSFSQYFGYIALDLVNGVVAVAAVYLFTTLIAVNVGTVFDNFALAGVLGILPISMYLICGAIWSLMTYGGDLPYDYILMLSPFTFGLQRFMNISGWMSAEVYRNGYIHSFVCIGIWTVIAAVLYFGAVACYRRRKSELAEQPQPGGVLQTIAKCFGAFCGGALFYAIFYHRGSMAAWVIAILTGALLIGIIGELILSRGVRALKKNLAWLLGAGALCVLVVVGSRFDFTGYSTRVPNPENVAVAYINYHGRFDSLSNRYNSYNAHGGVSEYNGMTALEDPADIAVVTAAHRIAVENQPPKDYEDVVQDQHPYQWTSITYKLKNGRTMTRYYNRMHRDAIHALTDLEERDAFIRQNHVVFSLNDPMVEESDPSRLLARNVTIYDSFGKDGRILHLAESDMARMLEAVRADMLAETADEIRDPTAAVAAYLEFQYQRVNYSSYDSTESCTVLVGQGYGNTIAVLSGLGILEGLDTGKEGAINEVYLVPAPYELGDAYRVISLIPDSGLSVEYAFEEYNRDYYVSSADDAVVRQVLAASRNQMYCSGDSLDGYDTVVVAFFAEGQLVGTRLVRYSALPDTLKSRLNEQFGENGSGEIMAMPARAVSVNRESVCVEELAAEDIIVVPTTPTSAYA